MKRTSNATKRIIAGVMAASLVLGTSTATVTASADSYSGSAVVSSESKLDVTSMTLTKGYKFKLSVKDTSDTPTYSTSNENVAAVDSDGYVAGKSAGTAVIYVDIGGWIYNCKVTVVETKASPESSSVSISSGSTTSVPVTVKGTKKLKAESMDKTVATVSWASEWDGNTIDLNIKGISSGSTQIKLYNPDYPSVYQTISVNVDSTGTYSNITVSDATISVGEGGTYTTTAYSTSPLSVSSSDTSIFTVSSTYSNGLYSVTVSGVSAGTANLAIYNTNNPSSYKILPVTVEASTGIKINNSLSYYVPKVYNIVNPSANTIEVRSYSDKIAYWAEEATGQLMYMVVPYNYVSTNDEVYVVSLLDTVYNAPMTSNINYYNYATAIGADTKYLTVSYLDLVHPSNNSIQMLSTDKLAWEITDSGYIVYRIIPSTAYYRESGMKYLMNADGTAAVTYCDYYKAYTVKPQRQYSTDVVLTYYDKRDGLDKFILVPKEYDKDRVDCVISGKKYVSSEKNTISKEFVSDLIDEISQDRGQYGFSKLKESSVLTSAATIRASEMSKKDTHVRPDGTSYETALDDAGAAYDKSCEIILKDVESEEDIYDLLLKNEDYIDMLHDPSFSKIGICYNEDTGYCVIEITD